MVFFSSMKQTNLVQYLGTFLFVLFLEPNDYQ